MSRDIENLSDEEFNRYMDEAIAEGGIVEEEVEVGGTEVEDDIETEVDEDVDTAEQPDEDESEDSDDNDVDEAQEEEETEDSETEESAQETVEDQPKVAEPKLT